MSGYSLKDRSGPHAGWRRTALCILAVLTCVSASVACADDESFAVQGVQAESERRAEIRRTMDVTGNTPEAQPAPRRRSMSAEERRRLREDIRANRDIYEIRERSNRARQ